MENENGYGLNVNTGVDTDQDERESQALKRRHGRGHGKRLQRAGSRFNEDEESGMRFDEVIGRPILFGTAEELRALIGERRIRHIWR